MAESVKIYDASEVTITFGGVEIESGFDDGEFCRIEQQEDGFITKVGTDGQVTRSKSNNRSTIVTLLLMQTSDGNDVLSAAHLLDLNNANGAGIAPLFIRDRTGRQIFTEPKAWVKKWTDVSFAREASAREWQLDCPSPERFDGGN